MPQGYIKSKFSMMIRPHRLIFADSPDFGKSTVLEGVVDRIVYSNPESGYTVVRFNLKGKRSSITIVGNLVDVHPGEELQVTGRWTVHHLYGEQFRVESHLSMIPATVQGVEKYLGSGLIDGIGPVIARRMVQHFGTDTIRVIEEEEERLQEVEGIGEKRAQWIRKAWLDQNENRDVMIFLHGLGISTTYAARIYQKYGSDTIEVIKENPYHLADDIFGIGFRTADQIARNLGIDFQSPLRAQAGVLYILKELSKEGHICYPLKGLIEKGREVLEMDEKVILEAVDTLLETRRVVVEDPVIYLPELYRAEVEVASRLRSLTRAPLDERLKEVDLERLLSWLDHQQRICLVENQRQAILHALRHKILIITGGPGTGKTTTIKSLLRVFEGLGWKVLLCAPTGRAAKRLNETVHRPAKTIHRLLEFSFQKGGFQRNEENPLDAEAIIVDEVSMIDLPLMQYLLRAIPPKASLILVGDADQLPSVGPGNVLRDIIASGVIQVIRLTEIFRQARQSLIVTNAHRINEGIYPFLPEWNEKKEGHRDLYFIAEEEPERVLEKIKELCTHWIPQNFGFHPIQDIQVLSPMNKGIVGTINLNIELQKALNPSCPGRQTRRIGRKKEQELVLEKRIFRLGDKVMQIRNNYRKGVFNGDIGWITQIDCEKKQITIEYDTGMIDYLFIELDEIAPAYCVSIHKGQGSEYPAIIVPLMTYHYILLQRNLLYTAITRARKLAVLIGSRKAIAMAVRNDKVRKRYTRLNQLLTDKAGDD